MFGIASFGSVRAGDSSASSIFSAVAARSFSSDIAAEDGRGTCGESSSSSSSLSSESASASGGSSIDGGNLAAGGSSIPITSPDGRMQVFKLYNSKQAAPALDAASDEGCINKVAEKFRKYFGYLHEPWERMRWQKPFCRVTLSRFWMSELIFCRGLPDLRIF